MKIFEFLFRKNLLNQLQNSNILDIALFPDVP